MNRLNFLYLGALITVAAAIQGNMLAMWLALAAIALTFVTIQVTQKDPKNSLFSLSSCEERKKRGDKCRPGRTPVSINDHGDNMKGPLKIGPEDNASVIADKVQDATGEITQMAMALASIHERKYEDGGGLGSACYVGCMAAAGSLIPIAMSVAVKPKLSEREIHERGKEVALTLVTPDTMLFAALLSTKILVNIDAKTGRQDWELNPETLFNALTDWEKLTGRKADGIIDPGMLRAAREVAVSSTVPLTEFMDKRSRSFPPTDTIQ